PTAASVTPPTAPGWIPLRPRSRGLDGRTAGARNGIREAIPLLAPAAGSASWVGSKSGKAKAGQPDFLQLLGRTVVAQIGYKREAAPASNGAGPPAPRWPKSHSNLAGLLKNSPGHTPCHAYNGRLYMTPWLGSQGSRYHDLDQRPGTPAANHR